VSQFPADRLGYLSAAPRVSTHPAAALGGARTHILGVVQGFRRIGWTVETFIAGDRMPRSWSSTGAERALRQNPAARLSADLLRLMMGPMLAMLAQSQLRGRIDWIYERAAVFQNLGSWFEARGHPWILEVNAPLSLEARGERRSIVLGDLARRVESSSYRRSDAVVTVSQALKDIIVRQAVLPDEKVLVVPNGVDAEHFNPERHPVRRVFEGPTIIFAGWLVPWQGIEQLIRAIALASEHGVHWSLIVLGDGPCRADWEVQADRLGLNRRVRFLGHLPGHRVPEYLAGADLGYVGHLPMVSGPMYHSPLKLYEYMAMAKPVVAPKYPEVEAAITPGETGYLFEPGDLASLVGALVEAGETGKGLVRLGLTARMAVVERHTWQHRCRAIIAGVSAILSRSGKRSPAERGAIRAGPDGS
jgi:glycosyltransferase involved in cell wall biosynthesis